ncbi:MAG: hypothetical protein ACFB8W_25035 [Elainellaceae cyanobacterium]
MGSKRPISLAKYLQEEFPKHVSPEWSCTPEKNFLPKELSKYLGYNPRADLLLWNINSSRRIWIEFEISRADPVANHTKFATAHLFHPQGEHDTFVSMASSHIAAGRRNLAEDTILLMRYLGMDAFHLALLPGYSKEEIGKINHSPIEDLKLIEMDVGSEVERIFSVIEPIYSDKSNRRIHFVGDLTEVVRNLRRWNRDIQTILNRELWGERTITYFVYDAVTHSFAPSKFCAYVPVFDLTNYLPDNSSDNLSKVTKPEMSIEIYQSIEQNQKIFDGKKARDYLNKCLCMNYRKLQEDENMQLQFKGWLERNSNVVRVHPRGPLFLTFPRWFM